MSRERWLPWALLLLLPSLLFFGALPGPRVVSAHDHLSVHHAFQEEAGGWIRHPQLSDPALQFESLHRLVVQSLRRGEAPLWNPDIFGGAPLLADCSCMAGSPVVWLRLLLPQPQAQDLGVWWILIWTALGTAGLTRALGAGAWASASAGAAAMTTPYLHVWLLHPHAAVFCWIPWVLWGLERGWGLRLTVVTAFMLSGGHAETAFAGLLASAWWWWRRGRPPRAVLAMFLGALLSMPVLLPFLEQLPLSATVSAHGGNTLPAAQLLDLVWPGWWGHPARGDWEGVEVWADAQLHPGLLTLALGLLAARGRRSRFLLWGWLACLALAVLGGPGPLNHARMASMGAWLLAVAAGLGAQRLPRAWGPLLFAGIALSGGWARSDDQAGLEPERHQPPAAAWTEQLREQLSCPEDGTPPGCGRVLGLGWALQPDTGSLVGLRDLRGYDLPVTVELERLQAALDPRLARPWFAVERPPPRGLMEFAAVRALLSPEPLEGWGSPLELEAPLSIYLLDPEAPRAWWAEGASPVGSPDEGLRLLRGERPPRGAPPVEGLGAGQLPSRGSWQALGVQEEGLNTLRLSLEGLQPGLVVVADRWTPGWQAELDGEAAPLLRVGGAFRGVLLTEPARELVMRYRPGGWVWGLRLALLGALLAGGWVGLRRRRELSSAPAAESPSGHEE